MSETFDLNLLRKTPLVITQIFLEILRAHFKNNSDKYKYAEDEKQTAIIIAPSFRWESDVIQKRPALYVRRGQMTFGPRVGIDDLESFDHREAEKHRTVICSCPVIVFCVSKQPGELELLAQEVTDVLLAFKSVIREDFSFQRFDLMGIGEIGLLEESEAFYTVPVSVKVEFTESWTLKLDSVKIKNLTSIISHAVSLNT